MLGGSEVESGYRDVQIYIQTLESHLDSTLIFHGPFLMFNNDSILTHRPEIACRRHRVRVEDSPAGQTRDLRPCRAVHVGGLLGLREAKKAKGPV